jgi:hypothetical protein
MTFGYLLTLLIRMCGTIDPGSYIRCVLGFGIKTRYDNNLTASEQCRPHYLHRLWSVTQWAQHHMKHGCGLSLYRAMPFTCGFI